MPEPFTDPRRLGCRRSHDAFDTKRSAVDERSDAFDGDVKGDLDGRIPLAKNLQQCNLDRPQALVSTLDAGGTADETNGSRTPQSAPDDGNRLVAWHLGREPERESSAPPGWACTRGIDELSYEAIGRGRSHTEERGLATPVETSADSSQFARVGQARQRLRHGIR